MPNYVNGPEIPLGLGMALAEDSHAMQAFAALPDAQKRAVIEQTHQIRSKQEMRRFVQGLGSSQQSF